MTELSPSPAPKAAEATPVRRSPVIPVCLTEAALDSPTFRTSALHFAEQVDGIERWLENYLKATTKLTHDIAALDESISSYLGKLVPSQSVADTVIDHDYTQLALKRVGDASRDHWTEFQSMTRRMVAVAADPVKMFINNDLRSFKESRRTLDSAQKAFDGTLARYLNMSKTKEASALREDAFAVFETRKAYLKSSLDYCQWAPMFRHALDTLLIRVSADLWNLIRRQRGGAPSSAKWHSEMERVLGWSKDMESSEAVFKREVHLARREIGEAALVLSKPSRDLEDYSASTVPFLSTRGPSAVNAPREGEPSISEHQGWLFLKQTTGKPARTSWIRRWFYCRDGIFGWLVQAPHGVLQGDEIGVLLCNAKPALAEDRRFSFQVKTKSQTMILQAETQRELSDWLEVFEVAKKSAFEASMARGGSSAPSGTSPAFSITAPMIPEFSAKVLDAITAGEDIGQASLSVPNEPLALAYRGSFDNPTARRSISTIGRDLAREDGESNREHAARIIQKLDLHRKATFGAGASDPPPSAGLGPAGGLSGNISGHPNAVQNAPRRPMAPGGLAGIEIPPGSLAPPYLAPPPMPTNLSRLAVTMTAERGLAPDVSRIMSTAVMANYWGSNPWSAVYSPAGDNNKRLINGEDIASPTGNHLESLGPNLESQSHQLDRRYPEIFPPGYPSELKAQHAQFRLLFPTAPMEEKLVLVFRATWLSSGRKGFDGPTLSGNGRVYVTPDSIYFYGHQLGLVVAYTLGLDFIAEVTVNPGKDCDFIVLRLSEDMNETGLTNIVVKTFLEDVTLLHARLNLLVDDLQAEEPMDVDEIITQLICLEEEDLKKSPSADSWEELEFFDTPTDGAARLDVQSQRAHKAHGGRGQARPPPPRPRLRSKVHLPSSPVVWEPDDPMTLKAERHFEVGAKACFHIIFGDDSLLFPRLYFERDARDIIQGPWILADNEHMRREIHFKANSADILRRSKICEVTDYQTIDVHRDHVTYVVTYVKRAWHLPHSRAFSVVAKIAITHISKSKCKLAIYVGTKWSRYPGLGFSKSMVDRQALNDATADAEDLAEAATDQIRRLGPRSRTKRAIQVYGHIGRRTQPLAFTPAQADAAKKQAVQPRRLADLLYETARSLGLSAVTSLLMWAFAALRSLFEVATAQRAILLVLGLSLVTNVFFTSLESSAWWRERRATRVMGRLGIGPNMMMSKGLYMEDLRNASGTTGDEFSWPEDSACFAAFQSLTNASSLDTSPEESSSTLASPTSRAAARRIRRTRQRLASYRHDLVVAMRVVNGVEREVVRSEWEHWLVDEGERCEEVRGMLAREAAGAGGDGQQWEGLEGLEGVRGWVEGYCGSCVSDMGGLRGEKRLVF